ncbi:MAG: hypothetical protein BAJALOKI2v1_340010 [Promethearchaeota archaeon]|nr:MAG: hypothetical protein BAJALOKI2v1_340010 [Candidatus Lokiarchaeota archaeon]
MESDEEKDSFHSMAFASFKENIGEKEENLTDKFNATINIFDCNEPKHGVFIAFDEENTSARFIWISLRNLQVINRENHGRVYDIYKTRISK